MAHRFIHHQQGGTIKQALDKIVSNEYVLPAIQREFVWSPEQICRLFDSLMQGYPFGEFLLWRIEPERSADYRYYGFVLDYHQRDDPHCPDLGQLPNRQITAVLDGQQRLTAFNIGLRGSMAVKIPYKWWSSPDAFPQRFLALDLLASDERDEEGSRFDFDFVEKTALGRNGDRLLFKVPDIAAMNSGPDMLDWLLARGLEREDQGRAYRILDRLYQVVHTEPTVAYYEELNQDIEPCLSGLHPHPLGLEWRKPDIGERAMDVLDRADLPFPHSLPEFQRLFPDDAACAAYLEKARWGDGFACPHCGTAGEPFHFENRPGVLRCRKCRQNTGLTVGTVMERSHTPLNVWFWAAYLVASQTPGMSAVQFQRQLGLSRYETAFQILHKLRSGMVRPNQDRIGGQPKNHVEVDETWVGGRTRGEGRGVHHKVPVSCAIEVRHRKPGTKLDNRKDGRYAGRVRLAVVLDRSAESLCGFVESTVAPGSLIVTDDWSGYAGLGKRGYEHFAVAECGDPEVAEQYLPIIHLVFANLKTWLIGIHHGVSHQHLQAYLNEFTFRFNRRFYPFNAFRSLL